MKRKINIMNFKTKKILTLVVTVVVFTGLQTQKAKAGWGDFDPNFGFLGAQIESMTDHYPSKVAFQPDGKILVTGYRLLSTGKRRLFLRRYLPSGQPDASFGSNGAAIVYSLVNKLDDDTGDSIAVLPTGQIAVAGKNKDNFPTVWQFDPDGRLDGEFGDGGRKILSNPAYQMPVNLVVQNRSLIVGVNKSGFSGNNRVVLLRLNSSGTPDSRFGTSGEAVTGILGFTFSLAVEAESGKITVGGHGAANIYHIGLERFMAGGQKDAGFVFADSPAYGYGFRSFIRLPNQKYVFKYADLPSFTNYYFTIHRLLKINPDGSQEASVAFYQGSETNWDCPGMLVQQQDGKVLTNSATIMHRFDSEINLSTQETRSCSNFSQMSDKTHAAIQPDDKLVVAGRYTGGGNLMLVRILPN